MNTPEIKFNVNYHHNGFPQGHKNTNNTQFVKINSDGSKTKLRNLIYSDKPN
jgi:hypothetical protein